MTRSSPLAVALVALTLGGCGSKAGDEKAVERTVKGVYDALADKDAKRVCDSISETGRRRLSRSSPARGGKPQSCEQLFSITLAFAGDQLKQAKNVDVSDVTVHGDQAKATVSYQRSKSDVGLVKEDGRWKLSGLDLAGG